MEAKLYKNLPIGVSDFRDVICSRFYYVDKTVLIQRLLDNQARAVLFTRPRRFGKSLALDMLHRFFDCNAKEENRSLFSGLAVSQSEHHMVEQGKYPIIHLTFKDAKYNSWQQAERRLALSFAEQFKRYEYLLSSERISQTDKNQLLLIQAGQADLDILSSSLSFLGRIMHRHHGQPVVLLIDEYDVPIQSAYQNHYYEDMILFMRSFFTAGLKDNPDLRLAVLTGVMRIAKESLFSGLNNLKVDTILSEDYADCFGFTQTEVEKMAHYYGRQDKIGELQAWYDGYRFGESDIYNPWSVLMYFSNRCKAQAYWLDTSSNDLTIEFLRRLETNKREQVWALYRGGTVKAAVDTAVSYQQLDSADPDIIFSLMAVTGYLKPIQALSGGRYLLQVPNAEINSVFSAEIAGYLKREHSVTDLQELLDALQANDNKAFLAKLRDILVQSVSFFDGQEAFYHGFITCLLLGLSEYYQVLSNREAGLGRADILLQPRFDNSLPGLVFELKRGDEATQLDSLAEDALRQIAEKQYAAAFPPEIREVRCYGLAFCKKECELRTESIRR